MGKTDLQIVLTVLVAGCSNAGIRPSDRTVRDSAGVELVSLSVPDTLGQQWRIAIDSRTTVIGGSDDSSAVFGRFGPGSALLLADGRIVTTAEDGNHIVVFDRAGRLVAHAGRNGEGPGEYRHAPQLIAYHDSIVAVDEAGGVSRVTVLDAALRFVREYRVQITDSRGSAPSPIGITDDGRLIFRHEYVIRGDSGAKRARASVLVAPAAGGTMKPVLQFDGEERLELAGGMNTFITFGRQAAAAVAGEQVFTGANNGFSVQSYDAAGRLHREWRIRLPATSVTESMRQGWIADQYTDTTAETGHIARLIVSSVHFASALREYEGFYPAREGGLWIERTRLRDRDVRRFWVFDSTGRFLAATSLPAQMRPVIIWGDSVMARGVDAGGARFLAIYPIVKSGATATTAK